MRKNNNRSSYIPYDPGVLPTKPAPKKGEEVTIKVNNYPPYKDNHFSIRNSNHPKHKRFLALRNKAIRVMGKRCWYFGQVEVSLEILAPKLEANKNLNDYAGGIADTLDGSSGATFTYLPIIFEDDHQISKVSIKFTLSKSLQYILKIKFI